MEVNNCSLRSREKKVEFIELIEREGPDTICGNESHLGPTVYTGEVFPPTYQYFRKDRDTVEVCTSRYMRPVCSP